MYSVKKAELSEFKNVGKYNTVSWSIGKAKGDATIRNVGNSIYIEGRNNQISWRYTFSEEDKKRYKDFLSTLKSEDTQKSKMSIDEKKEELKKRIVSIAEDFKHSPEKLAELAVFQSKFHNYSYGNTMLILSQNSGASFVGSFKRLKEIGESIAEKNNVTVEGTDKPPYWGVTKGSIGMQIYVPVEITMINIAPDKWVQFSNATKQQQTAAEAGIYKTLKKTAFKLGTVFDISQTSIPTEYYPQIYSMGYNSEQHAKIFNGLKEYIEKELNCPVDINIDNSIALRGQCYTTKNKIELNDRLKDTLKLSTLSHELGHFIMHHEKNVPTSTAEVEADIYDIMLENHFGIEPNEARKSHLATNYNNYVNDNANEETSAAIEKVFSTAKKAYSDTIDKIDEYVETYLNRETVEEIEQEDFQEFALTP